MRKGFWLHLVIDPFTALDLVDREGRPDHGKILPAILLFSAIIAQFLDKQYSLGVLIALGSLSYGYGMWRTFLRSKAATATEHTENVNVKIKQRYEEILSKRDVENGVDPA